jgi:Protein of unknown function (DUF1360)
MGRVRHILDHVTWWAFAVAVGATIRLTRLITADKIAERIRFWFAKADARRNASNITFHGVTGVPEPARSHAWFDFITCPWCISVWIAAAVFGLYGATPGHLRVPLTYIYAALTASLLAGLALTSKESSP